MWPNREVKVENPEVEGSPEAKAPEKSPAEIIAESVANALKPFADSVNARFDAIDAATKRPAPKAEPEVRAQRVSIFEDEDAALAQAMTPLLQRQLEMESRMTRNEVKAEYSGKGYSDLWAQFEGEITSTLENSPLVGGDGKVLRGDPGYIRNVVDMIFGRAALKAGMKFGGKDKGFFLESAGGSVDGNGRTTEQLEGVTVEQKRVFDRMKVPLADAKKTIGKLKFIS